jgi:phosphate transport system permease protein
LNPTARACPTPPKAEPISSNRRSIFLSAASFRSTAISRTSDRELPICAPAPTRLAPTKLSRELPSILVEINGGVVKASRLSATGIEGEVIIPLESTADAAGDDWSIREIVLPERNRKLDDRSLVYLDLLADQDRVERTFNTVFFTSGASREAELAGIWGAVVGSFFTMVVTLALAFPLGVAAAIYLEEFAPKNRLTQIIEVNINNLAAVPSIVFGLLGLAVFLNVFGMPRSAPVVGGMVLALMTLPTIIIASRAALRAVPPPSARVRSASVPRNCRPCCIMCCRWRCQAF